MCWQKSDTIQKVQKRKAIFSFQNEIRKHNERDTLRLAIVDMVIIDIPARNVYGRGLQIRAFHIRLQPHVKKIMSTNFVGLFGEIDFVEKFGSLI